MLLLYFITVAGTESSSDRLAQRSQSTGKRVCREESGGRANQTGITIAAAESWGMTARGLSYFLSYCHAILWFFVCRGPVTGGPGFLSSSSFCFGNRGSCGREKFVQQPMAEYADWIVKTKLIGQGVQLLLGKMSRSQWSDLHRRKLTGRIHRGRAQIAAPSPYYSSSFSREHVPIVPVLDELRLPVSSLFIKSIIVTFVISFAMLKAAIKSVHNFT